MNIQQQTKRMLAAVAISAVAIPAHAKTCHEQSPLMLEIGEHYAQLQYSREDETKKQLQTKLNLLDFFNSKNLRTGKGERVSCRGAGSHGRDSRIKFTLEDINRVETANGNVQITAWEESTRKAASAVIDLPPAEHWKTHSKNTLSTTFIFRRSNNRLNTKDASFKSEAYLYNGRTDTQLDIDTDADNDRGGLLDFPNRDGSHVVEIETRLQKRGSGMTLTQTYYVNGLKAEWVTWQLEG